MKNIDFVTCKLIFECGIKEDDVVKLLSKYTTTYAIGNFVPEIEIGCNKNAFAVVDVPDAVMCQLYNDHVVKQIDPMTTFTLKQSNAECCSGGGCGCGP